MDERHEVGLLGGEDPQVIFSRLQRLDWELLSVALVLLTAFAGGLVAYVYGQGGASATQVSSLTLVYTRELVVGLVALVILLNIYLVDRKRLLTRLWQRHLSQGRDPIHVAYRLQRLHLEELSAIQDL